MADKILNVKLCEKAHVALKGRAKKRGCSKRFLAKEILESDLLPEKKAATK